MSLEPRPILSLLLGFVMAGQEAKVASVEGTVYAPNVRPGGGVVYLLPVRKTREPLPPRNAVLDQVNLEFVPRVVVVPPGSTVDFLNSDPILHNVFSPAGPGPGFNLGIYPRKDSRLHTFREKGAHVILCHVHPEMYAYVLVVPTTLFGRLDAQGHFRITGVPPGRYTLEVWHPHASAHSQPLVIRSGSRVKLKLELSSKR